jgi:hypothetical protein
MKLGFFPRLGHITSGDFVHSFIGRCRIDSLTSWAMAFALAFFQPQQDILDSHCLEGGWMVEGLDQLLFAPEYVLNTGYVPGRFEANPP